MRYISFATIAGRRQLSGRWIRRHWWRRNAIRTIKQTKIKKINIININNYSFIHYDVLLFVLLRTIGVPGGGGGLTPSGRAAIGVNLDFRDDVGTCAFLMATADGDGTDGRGNVCWRGGV